MSTLQNSAMLATLTISQWTNRKHDKSVSKEVEQQHQAKDAGRYNKMLIDKAALDPISKIASAARMYHYKVTLPWGDNGDRLLPATLFMPYTDTMRQYKNEFAARVATFVRDYPLLVNDARTRLGTMYDAMDYPLASDIADKFAIETEFTPIPTAADFRVNLNQEYVDSIKTDITQKMAARQADAVKHCWQRIREVVEHLEERLSDKDKTFRDSLISNAVELIDILPALNITGDTELERTAAEVKAILVAPERLRADEGLRADTAARAAAILASLPFAAA